MTAALDEKLGADVLFTETADSVDSDAMDRNHNAVVAANQEAAAVDAEALAAFFDLLSAADCEYIDTQDYAPAPSEPALDWDAVASALNESQRILVCVQNLLSETLAAMGVEGHQYIRVYSDLDGSLRLVSEHPRRAEIEAVLNSPENQELRNLHQAAMTGMSLAGGLVGTFAVPDAVMDRIRAKEHAA